MKNKNLILISILVIFGVLSRTIFHLGANIEFVTAISILAGYLFKKSKLALIIPLLIMIPSDIILGNTNIFLFTWSGFLFPVLMGKLLSTRLSKFTDSILKISISSSVLGVISTLFFYFWTNLGHFLTTNMYPKTLEGLVQCFVNAIPFLKPQLFSNFLIVPLIMIISIFALNLSVSKFNKANTQKNS